MSEQLNRLKGLLVASCDSLKQGNRDIASNLMEIALDEMNSLEAEDINIGLSVVNTVEDNAENAFENEVFEDEPLEETAAYSSLHSIVAKMVAQK